jgi:hypothetical protein
VTGGAVGSFANAVSAV